MSFEDEFLLKQHGCYHLTLNVVDWTDIFIKPVFKQIIAESLNYFVAKKGLIIHGWCLMTNHLHVIARSNEGIGLTLIANEFKKFTTKIIIDDIDAESEVRRNWILKKFKGGGRTLTFRDKTQVWQSGISPVQIELDDPDELLGKLDFIHSIPVRDRVVNKPEDYIYSSARDYAGMPGLVNVSIFEQTHDSNFILRHIYSYR